MKIVKGLVFILSFVLSMFLSFQAKAIMNKKSDTAYSAKKDVNIVSPKGANCPYAAIAQLNDSTIGSTNNATNNGKATKIRVK